MASNEWLLRIDNVVDSTVGVESGFDLVESDDGSVGTSSTIECLSSVTIHEDAKVCTYPLVGEKPIASWNVSRRDS